MKEFADGTLVGGMTEWHADRLVNDMRSFTPERFMKARKRTTGAVAGLVAGAIRKGANHRVVISDAPRRER